MKDDCRGARGLRVADELDRILTNIRFGLRMLVKTPVVTGVAVVSLALGMGSNAAIFSLFSQVLLRPLPVSQPERLVNLAAPEPKPGSTTTGPAGGFDEIFSYPMFRDLQRDQTVFTDIAAHRNFTAHITYGRRTIAGPGLQVSGSYFPVLGLAPAAGRLLGPESDAPIGGHPTAVLAHEFWQVRFGGAPDVVGDTLIVNGQPLDHRGRGAGRLRGHDARRTAADLRADHHAGRALTGRRRIRGPPELLGLSLRSPQAERVPRPGAGGARTAATGAS